MHDLLFLQDEDVTRKLRDIQDHFEKFADGNENITKAKFMEAIGDNNKSFLAERFFDSLDTDHGGTLDMEELTKGAKRILSGTLYDRVAFIFSLYDENGDGQIGFDELKQVLLASTKESNMHLNADRLESLTKTFLDELDEDGDGVLQLSELDKFLQVNPSLVMTIANESISWLLPPEPKKKEPVKPRVPLAIQIKNNIRMIAFFTALILINIFLCIINGYNYRESNWWIILARGPGMCLDFDVCFFLLLPLKRFITLLRMTVLRYWLPLDDNIFLHMTIVIFIVFHTVVHTLAHIGNAVTVHENYNVTVLEFIFTTKANLGWVGGLAPITGVILVIILAIMVVCSLPCVRRSGHFQLFFWTHKLYFVFYILCILHATHFWKWFLVPGFIFIVEMITFYWYKEGVVEEVGLLPSGVTSLKLRPSTKFRFNPGDYVHICIPALTRYEWHPFTISSSPLVKDTFGLHIRSCGSWTDQLREYFTNKEEVEPKRITGEKGDTDHKNDSNFQRGDDMATSIRSSMRKRAVTKLVNDAVYITGPFGTPCREIFETEHPILIGAGIGVTPFASILQTIFMQVKKAAVTCPQCDHRWFGAESKQTVKKVDFIWINRSSRSFEWFAELLFQLEEEFISLDLKDFIKLHLYMTGAAKMQELRGLGIQVALEINYKKTKTDALTGLHTKTKAGRPNFAELFCEIKSRSRYKKKAFFCGAPVLGEQIKTSCDKFGFEFSQEQF